ncbi:hypothetical protein Droror1_Dr00026350 [Drosera rotundifolia]
MPPTLSFTAAATITPHFPFTSSSSSPHLPPRRRLRLLKSPIIISSLSTTHNKPSPPPPPPPAPPQPVYPVGGGGGANFEEKALFLDSLGLDPTHLLAHHPTALLSSSVTLSDLQSLKDFLSSFGFSLSELRRLLRVCPSLLALSPDDLHPNVRFLVNEVDVKGRDLRRAINHRPTLLTSSVDGRLRPALYFLKGIGVRDLERYTGLLVSGVEERFVPKLEYFEKLGFGKREVVMMFRRFPLLFNYGIETNYVPKMRYFVVEMGRELRELFVFPQYFSFSLERRIVPRHRRCVEVGVCLPLQEMLKPKSWEFEDRLKAVCGTCQPLCGSPLFDAEFE